MANEYLIISVLFLQSVSMFLSIRKVLRSRCTSELDIEKNIQIRERPTGVR